MEENIRIEISETNREKKKKKKKKKNKKKKKKKKSKLLLKENINLIFQMKRKIIQKVYRYTDYKTLNKCM